MAFFNMYYLIDDPSVVSFMAVLLARAISFNENHGITDMIFFNPLFDETDVVIELKSNFFLF